MAEKTLEQYLAEDIKRGADALARARECKRILHSLPDAIRKAVPAGATYWYGQIFVHDGGDPAVVRDLVLALMEYTGKVSLRKEKAWEGGQTATFYVWSEAHDAYLTITVKWDRKEPCAKYRVTETRIIETCGGPPDASRYDSVEALAD